MSSLDRSSPAPNPSAHVVELTVRAAVTRSERAFSYLRGVFCLAVLGLALLTNSPDAPGFALRLALELGIAIVGIGFSLWTLHRTHRGPLEERDLRWSVFVDGALCTLGLATNGVGPSAGYAGVLASLDVAVVPLLVTSSIFRVSRGATLTSGLTNALGLAILLALDAGAGHELPGDKLLLLGLYLAASVAVALFGVRRAREIFARVGKAATRAEHARGSVFSLLEDHHDLRSILCHLQLNADRLVESGSLETSPTIRALHEDLERGITELGNATARTRDRALFALEGLENPAEALVERAVADATALVRERFPELVIENEVASSPAVSFGAGTEGLTRLFVHLFVNAAEGDGKRGAHRVRVKPERGAPTHLRFVVSDDGPGFGPTLLGIVGRKHGTSTKSGSGGIGLWLTRSTVEAIGGRIEFTNGPSSHDTPGGARVTIELPLHAS